VPTIENFNDESAAVSPFSPREELSAILKQESGRIGQVHDLLEQGKSQLEIAEELGIAPTSAPSYIADYRNAIDAILDGKVPSPSRVVPTARKLGSFAKRANKKLSKPAQELFSKNYDIILAARNSLEPTVGAYSEQEAEEAEVNEIGSLHVPGIYAFSYGHYLDYPVDLSTGNTLTKVGKADDVATRIAQHRSGVRTHIPEPLVTLRVYEVDPDTDLNGVERQFHRLLATAGHQNPHATSNYGRSEVGREWFLTNSDFLDQIAAALNLKTSFTN